MKIQHNFSKISIAPMLGYTDRHYRCMMRLITQKTMLYTEMMTTNEVLRGKYRVLKHSKKEHPLTLQLAGRCPQAFISCAKIAEKLGFNEINLNVGCPSKKLSDIGWGLTLMREPELLCTCIVAIKNAVNIPVSVKCRIGIDENNTFEHLDNFVGMIFDAGIDSIILHARNGLLNLNPKKNRTIPKIDYSMVYKIKYKYPTKKIGINGNINTLQEIKDHLKIVDHVMLGRAAYSNPMLFSEVERYLLGVKSSVILDPVKVSCTFLKYIENEFKQLNHDNFSFMLRHILQLFNGSTFYFFLDCICCGLFCKSADQRRRHINNVCQQ